MKKHVIISIALCLLMLFGATTMCFAERIQYGIYVKKGSVKSTSVKLQVYCQKTKKPTVYVESAKKIIKKNGKYKTHKLKDTKTAYFNDYLCEREADFKFKNLKKNTKYVASFTGANGKKYKVSFTTKK